MLPRGMRDFPPEVMRIRRFLMQTARAIFVGYGFVEMDTPVVELWETLMGKYGEEAEKKLVFKFTDELSGKKLALRYDLTVPLMRFMASKGREYPLPFKRFHIAKVWRHDEPQKGRYREFMQADADIVGSSHPLADAEILEVFSRYFESLSIPFEVHVNHRKAAVELANAFFGEKALAALRIVDKMDKIGKEGVLEELEKRFPQVASEEFLKELERLKMPGELEEILNLVPKKYKKHVLFDPFLVRGLDYYTGMIFEIKVPSSGYGTFSAGGRYDRLSELFGLNLPAVGGSIGIDRLLDFLLEGEGIVVEEPPLAYIVNLGASMEYIQEIRHLLVENGLRTRIDVKGRNWRKQLEEARKLGSDAVLFVGKKEEESKTVGIEIKGERFEVPFEKLEKVIKDLLSQK